jgi:hypothetical protein
MFPRLLFFPRVVQLLVLGFCWQAGLVAAAAYPSCGAITIAPASLVSWTGPPVQCSCKMLHCCGVINGIMPSCWNCVVLSGGRLTFAAPTLTVNRVDLTADPCIGRLATRRAVCGTRGRLMGIAGGGQQGLPAGAQCTAQTSDQCGSYHDPSTCIHCTGTRLLALKQTEICTQYLPVRVLNSSLQCLKSMLKDVPVEAD